MKAIFCGLAAVIGLLAAAGISIGVIILWFEGCDWVWARGHHYLAAALTPMAFILYLMLALVFWGVYSEFKD